MSAETFVVDDQGNKVDLQFFIVRPPVICAMCGHQAHEQHRVDDLTRREVWCAVPSCSQYNKHVVMRDPIARGSALPVSQ